MLDRRQLLLSSTAAALAGCAGVRPGGAPTAAAGPGSPALNTLLEQFAQEVLAESPESRTALGLDKGEFIAAKYRLDDRSDEAVARRLAQLDNRLARLRSVPREPLAGRDAVNYDVVAYGLESEARLGRFRRQDYVVHQLGGVYQSIPDFLDTQHSIKTRADAEAYLSRLQAFARNIDQETERLNLSAAAGTIAPDFIIDKTLGQMRALRNTPAAETVMVTSIARRTRDKNIPGDWAAQATRIVTGEIRPALDRQLASLARLRPRATHDAGVWRLRDGEAYYAAALENQTTTKLTPDEVHELGRSIARDLTARADVLLRSQDMTQGTVAQRIAALGRDPRHIYPNTESGKAELLRDLNEQIRVLNAKLPQVFATLPKAAVEVRRVPAYIEAGAPGGYYNQPTLDGSRPGAYYINLRDTAEWPRWSLPTLTYHEASPGHHLQIALMLEDQNSPLLRKMTFFNAYTEGWALRRAAGPGDRHVPRRSARRDRLSAVGLVPRRPPGRRHRPAPQALEPRARHPRVHGHHRRPGVRAHHRDRALRRLAGPGDRLHGGQDRVAAAARGRAAPHGRALRHPRLPRRGPAVGRHAAHRARAGDR